MKINLKIIDPKKADDGSRYVQKHRIGGRDILVFNRQNNEFLSLIILILAVLDKVYQEEFETTKGSNRITFPIYEKKIKKNDSKTVFVLYYQKLRRKAFGK